MPKNLFDDDSGEEEYKPNAPTVSSQPSDNYNQYQNEERQSEFVPSYTTKPSTQETKNAIFDDEDQAYQPNQNYNNNQVYQPQKQSNFIDDEEEYVPQASQPTNNFDYQKQNDYEEPYVPYNNQKDQYEQIPSQTPSNEAKQVPEIKKQTVRESEVADTDAETKLKAETEKARNELIAQIKSFSADDAKDAAEVSPDIENPRVLKFTVQDPIKLQGHVVYNVTGEDDEGDFKAQRRFREFEALFTVLKSRWFGCYIPAIPEKKLLKNQDQQLIDERRELLENFMKGCAKFDYIIFSKEFKLFARGTGEIDKVLQAIPKQTPLQTLEKYRLNFKVNENADTEDISKYQKIIGNFMKYLRQAASSLHVMKGQLKTMANVRNKGDASQLEYIKVLMKYEDIAVNYYGEQDYTKRILTHPTNEGLVEKVKGSEAKLRNPYQEAYLWVKGEYLDVLCMIECLNGREQIMKFQIAAEEKKRSDLKELEKLSAGKTTMKSLFSSKAKKEGSIITLQSQQEVLEAEIGDFQKLVRFLTIYHGNEAISNFKTQKAKLYLRMLNNFCVKEISNAHTNATLYHGLLGKKE